MSQTILAISAHPDDETLGCGGTLLKHRGQGCRLAWLVVTRALARRWSDADRDRKGKEIQSVSEAYGFSERVELGLPSSQLDEVPLHQLMGGISDAIESIRPHTVYLVHGEDVHTDHHAVFTATMSVLKPFHMARLGVRRVVCYETLSSTEAAPPRAGGGFVPTVFTDISPYIEQKLEIMAMYESEVQADPMPRGPSAIRALARYRGATIGVDYAEAGMLVRELE